MENVLEGSCRFKEPSIYGLKIKLDHKYPLKPQQIIDLKPRQLLAILPLTMRYLNYYMGVKRRRKKPIMDFLNFISAQQIYGCPLGGIGGGSIGRGFRGEFTRFQLRPGIYEYKTVPECQFIVNIRDSHNATIFQSVLSTSEKPKKCQLEWEWNIDGSDCDYTALYPKAWTVYDLSKYGVKLTCRQISPIIPHNYKDSSLPCAVFVWNVTNVCGEERIVNIAFTWAEISNTKKKTNTLGKLDLERYSDEHTSGVLLEQTVGNSPCTFTIAKPKQAGENITEGYCFFNSERTSSMVWDSLDEDGKLMPDAKDTSTSTKDMKNHNNGIGLSHSVKTCADEEVDMEFVLVWDLPTVQFHKKGKIYKRYYTKYFGSEGLSGRTIAAYALQNYQRWEEEISDWQDPIFNNSNIPDWLKGALMNELYYVADGGTIWFDTHDDYPISDPRHEFGLFGYLEGHEYRMYSTYDVHFYASFALAQLWPNLQVSLQYMFKDTIAQEVATTRRHLYDGKTAKRKQKNSVPHDLGDPEEDPFTAINAYNVHDVSEWRDLNSKFILQVFRDYSFLLADEKLTQTQTNSEADSESEIACERQAKWQARRYLEDMWPACLALVTKMSEWDKDGDGLIENTGSPDQTFDAWVMTGPSAYCSGLWITALQFMKKMAEILRHPEELEKFTKMLQKATESFNTKLWDETHYKFDSSPRNSGVVMAGQLTGQWYLRACGFHHEVFPSEKVGTALNTIYANNVLQFCDGKMGAVNGYVLPKGTKPGHVDHTAIQSEEVWTGVTYGLASVMVYEGMHKEAMHVAGGMYNTISQNMGMNFETPEALYGNGNHRSIGYMRPLSIWGLYHAIISSPVPTNLVPNGAVTTL